jgi:hypothetical protein
MMLARHATALTRTVIASVVIALAVSAVFFPSAATRSGHALTALVAVIKMATLPMDYGSNHIL